MDKYSNLKGWNTVSKVYGVKAVPQNFLIDPDGIIISKNIESDKMIEKLNNILPSTSVCFINLIKHSFRTLAVNK